MMADKGETLAFEVLDETGSIDEGLKLLNERRDSLTGKMIRLNREAMNYREHSKKARRLQKERAKFWIDLDLLEEAILSIQAIVKSEASELLNLRHEDFEDDKGFQSFLALPATVKGD